MSEGAEDLVEQLAAVNSTVNTAGAMELCSTSEVLDLFSEYYAADREEMESNFLLNDSSTNTDIDFEHAALHGSGVAASDARLARAVVGSNSEQFDVLNMISD